MHDEDVTQSEFAARTGLSRQRVSSLVASGTLAKNASGKIPWLDGLRALIAALGKTAAGRGESELSKARTRLADAQREAVEHKNSVARGEMVPAKDVARTWGDALATIRSCVMSIPTRAAAVIPNLTRHDCSTLDDVVREVLNDAADMLDGAGDDLVDDPKAGIADIEEKKVRAR